MSSRAWGLKALAGAVAAGLASPVHAHDLWLEATPRMQQRLVV
jgi:hypothetical protein